MEKKDLQALLSSVGFYKGDIDGIIGPQTRAAIKLVLSRANPAFLNWTEKRQIIGAAQIALDLKGHEPGAIDGYFGHNTREALNDFYSVQVYGKPRVIERVPVATKTTPALPVWPRQADLQSFYGPAGGPQCTAGRVQLPVAFVVAWNRDQAISVFYCHEKVAKPMQSIFEEAVKAYGPTRYSALALDVYGGCYNYRKMRGGKALSTHAYGIATDLDPENNQLKWGREKAKFARPEYDVFWNIVEAHGAISLGRAANMDWMHFQFARL